MKLPSRKEVSRLLDIVHSIEYIEDNRNKEEIEIYNKLLNKTISKKNALQKLKQKKLLKQTKETDSKIIKKIVEYNTILNTISKDLEIPGVPKYKVKSVSFIKKLLKQILDVFPAKISKQHQHKTIKEKVKVDIKKEEKKVTKIKKPIVATDVVKAKKNAFISVINKFIPHSKPKEFESKEDIVINPIKSEMETPNELKPENYSVLIPGYAYAFVQEKNNERKYIVAEPELTKDEEKILAQTKEELITKISLIDLKDEKSLFKQIDKIFEKNKVKVDDQRRSKIVYYIIRQIKGLDKLEPLMHDPLIEDIECDGMNIPVFIVHRKYGHIETNVIFDTEKELQQFVIKMSHLSKSYVSYASPLLDAILPDGSRVNATLTSNVSTRGPSFTIRKFPQKPLTAIDLIISHTLNPMLVSYLWTIMEFKKTVMIVGPTAAGKTTLMNVITSFIPEGQRVVSIEDTREINLLMNNWVPQVTRPGFGPPDNHGKRYGEVTMTDLLKESFRQRPDYLIIGEVRGEEMALMFQGMASGHCCISTVHARTLNDLVNRLVTPPISLESSLLTSLDVVLVAGFSGGGETKRHIKEIDEIRGYNVKDNKVEYNAIYSIFDKQPDTKKSGELFTHDLPITYKSEILKDISREFSININDLLEVINKRVKFIEGLVENKPKDYVEFKLALNKFKRNEELLKDFNN